MQSESNKITKSEWIKLFPGKYRKAHKLGLLPEISKEMGWDTAAINKELIKKLDKKPSIYSKDPKESRLGRVLANYIGKFSNTYDPAFDEEIRKLKPNWFIGTVAANKELIKKLNKRPNTESKDPEERKLGNVLAKYIRKKSGCYDPEFDKEIRRLKPDWFLDTAMINKQLIRRLNKRPRQSSKDPEEKRLSALLNSYITRTHRGYDPIFDAEIRKLKPDWFKKESNQ